MKRLYNIYMSNGDIYTNIAESEAEAVYTMCNGWVFRDSYKRKPNYKIDRVEAVTNKKTIREWEALRYAEDHGIIEYHLSGKNMVYYTTFPLEHNTYKAVVNLDTLKETRQPLKNYYKPYKSLVCGKYQANYCI